jgi:hypothetical protein
MKRQKAEAVLYREIAGLREIDEGRVARLREIATPDPETDR